ncbi:ankyrin repeat domain-containing protein [Shewanella sp.]|uniref:ankyrin repeat domain-containing protein n=1 Tax=Shewanella sp. TaxID=50422 RepID=UPI003A96AB76
MLFTPFSTLISLIRGGNVSSLSTMLSFEKNYHATDEDGRGLLYYAIHHTQAEIAAMLLEAGVDPTSGAERPGQPVMEHVVASLSRRLLRLFLAHGETLPKYIDGLPVLHYVLQFKNVRRDYLQALLAFGVDINAIDERNTGLTPLAFYIGNDDVMPQPRMVRTLIELGADVNLGNKQTDTPLCQMLSNPLLADSHSMDEPRRVAIPFILQALLDTGELQVREPESPAEGFDSVPTIALKNKRFSTFLTLLDLEVNIPKFELPDLLPFFTFANFPSEAMRNQLLSLNQQQQLGLPIGILFYPQAEYLTVIDQQPDEAELLNSYFTELVPSSNINLPYKLRCLERLLAKGVDINVTCRWYERELTSLQVLICGYEQIEHADALISWLLEHGAALESHGHSAFLFAIWYQRIALASMLADRGADLFYQEQDKSTLFTKLFTRNFDGNKYSAEALTDTLPKLNRLYQSHGVELPLDTPFYYNMSRNDSLTDCRTLAHLLVNINGDYVFMMLARALLQVGWDINKRVKPDSVGNLITYWCLNANEGDDISPLLEQLPQLDVESDEAGPLLRHAISNKVALPTMRCLLARCTDVNRPYKRYPTDEKIISETLPLLQMVLDWHNGDSAMALTSLLLEMGADPNITLQRELVPGAGDADLFRWELSALETATRGDNLDVVELLLDNGADPHQPISGNGEHYVHFLMNSRSGLSQERVLEYLQLLQRKGMLDVTERNEATQATPLVFASINSRLLWMRYLLDLGADPSASGGWPPQSCLHKVTGYETTEPQRRLTAVKMLLDAGADINAVDEDGDTPLHIAAALGENLVVAELLGRGANVDNYNEQGNTPLIRALMNNRAVEIEIDSELPEAEQRALQAAEKMKTLNLLLTGGANINLASQKEGFTPLMLALYRPQLALVPHLIKLGASLATQGEGPSLIWFALRYTGHEAQQLLLQYLNLEEVANTVETDGDNLLHAVAQHADFELASSWFTLLQQQFKVPYQPNSWGITPLHLAAYQGNVAIVKAALSQGHDINASDERGNTPLHFATFFRGDEQHYEDCVKPLIMTLVLGGADPLALNEQGQSPLDVAKEREMADCVGMMQLAAARGPVN